MPGADAKRRKDAAREAAIVSSTACPACGAPPTQKCREGTQAHDPKRGIEDLRPQLQRTHRERRALWQESKQ